SLGDQVLATGEVTRTIVDGADEQGQATVTFTIPAGLAGTQVLTISGPGGTSATLPIEVADAQQPQEPVRTSTSASAPLLVWNAPVDYKVTVRAAGGSPAVGQVVVRDGLKVIATVDLKASDNGKVTVKLGKLKRGIHL